MKKEFDRNRLPADRGIDGSAAAEHAVGPVPPAADFASGSGDVSGSGSPAAVEASDPDVRGGRDPGDLASAGFRVSVGYATAAAEEISGDTAISSGLPDGSLALILSDGMGKGIRAAALSRSVASRLRKNLKGGMAPAHAIKEVNAYMLSHGESENFATVDLLIIDRTTEKAKFYKMGAATSFVLREGRVKMLEKAALPVGIVPKVRSTQISEQLRHGDIVIMVSDGITEAARISEAAGTCGAPGNFAAVTERPNQSGAEAAGAAGSTLQTAGGIDGTWLRELLEIRSHAGHATESTEGAQSVNFSGMSSRRMAKWILNEAVAKYADRERDDLTVAVIKIV